MSFSEIEMALSNVGLTLNEDLTVQVSSDEEATDAEIILESYFGQDCAEELGINNDVKYIRIVWA
jgi:hypothetical protein